MSAGGHKPGYRRRYDLEGASRPYAEGTEAGDHVRRLVALGMSRSSIEKAAGVDYRTVRNALEGRRLQRDKARAILAVRPRVTSLWCYVPAGPSLELVERMWAQGYSKAWIAEQIGVHNSEPVKPGQRFVRAWKAKRIRELAEFVGECRGVCRDGRSLGKRDNGRRSRVKHYRGVAA